MQGHLLLTCLKANFLNIPLLEHETNRQQLGTNIQEGVRKHIHREPLVEHQVEEHSIGEDENREV